MNRIIFLFLSLAGLMFIFQQCAPSKTISTQRSDDYEEDISRYRIQYTDSIDQATSSDDSVVPNPEERITVSTLETPYSVTEDMSEYFEAVDDLNRERNEYQGFTLQVYAGNSRERANEAKLKVYDALPDSEPKMAFNTLFRVRVGEYDNRLEAQQDYIALKEFFPNVLFVPATFPVVD
ncbi:MAG: SPOR domain-containing protein [Bacteroidota bacterium]